MAIYPDFKELLESFNITNKKAAGRPQDIVDADRLEEDLPGRKGS